jgi:hypothetical protein
MSNFFSQVALSAGNNLLVGAKLDSEQASTDLKRQEVAASRMNMEAAQNRIQTQKEIAGVIQKEIAADKDSVSDPIKAVETYNKGKMAALAKGDFASVEEMDKLAKGALAQGKANFEGVQAKVQGAKETLSAAAYAYNDNKTPEGRDVLARAALKAGIPIEQIPLTNDPKFDQWAQSQTKAPLTGKERLAAEEKVREFDTTTADRKQRAVEHEQTIRAQQAATAAFREASQQQHRDAAGAAADARAARLDDKRSETGFREEQKLISVAERTAKPLIDDRDRVTAVKSMLSKSNSSVGDHQVQEALSSVIGTLKSRATNVLYKDNKGFGDVIQRVDDFTSRTFTGRYSDQSRKDIFKMLDDYEGLLDTSLTGVEKEAQRKGKAYNLDPERITLSGNFNRVDGKAAPLAAPKDRWTGEDKRSSGGKLPPGATESRTVQGTSYYTKGDKDAEGKLIWHK